jgi:DNA-binding beta-propeller fold protein YncE
MQGKVVRRHVPFLLAVTVAIASITSGLGFISKPASAQTFTGMRPERIMAAPSMAALVPWGVAYDPVSGDLLVSDYDSNQVRMFNLQGTFLGDVGAGGTQNGPPGSIAVDPRDGSFYVDVWANHSVIRKYSANGTFLYEIDNLNDGAWITVDSSGILWIPDGQYGDHIHGLVMGDTTASDVEVATLTVPGAQYFGGIDTDAAGNLYVDDMGNHALYSLTQTGQIRWEDINSTLFPGDVRGVAVNKATNQVYVSNVSASTIDVLDTNGNLLSSFGSSGTGPGQFTSGSRGLAIDPSGNVWAADYGGARMEEFSAGGTFMSSFPAPGLVPDPLGLDQPHGVAVNETTGDVYIADTYNERVLHLASDGTLLGSFGHRGSNAATSVNYPEAVAVDPVTGDVWVASHQGPPNLVEYNASLTKVIKQLTPPKWITDLVVSNGLIYTTPDFSGTMNVYNESTGALVEQYDSPWGALNGVGVDPSTGNIWLTPYYQATIYVLSPNYQVIGSMSLPTPGWGVAFSGSQAYVAVHGSGEIAVYNNTSFAPLGTFATPGTGFGQLASPTQLALDAAGDLYVVESGNDRVQVFSPSAPPASEKIKPAVAITTTQVSPEVVASGTATDTSGIALVQVQATDTASGLTYNAKTNSYGSPVWSPAPYWGPTTAVNWRFTIPLTAPGDPYTISVRAQDIFGNTSTPVSVSIGTDFAPAGLSLTGSTTGGASLTWIPAADSTTDGVTSYTATAVPFDPSMPTLSCSVPAPATGCTLPTVAPGAEYATSVTATVSATTSQTSGVLDSVPVQPVSLPVGTLPSGSIALWLDAADIDGNGVAAGSAEGGLSNGTVSTWADKSGNGDYLQPTSGTPGAGFDLTFMNGMPTLTFGANNLESAATVANYGITGNRSLFMVVRARQWTSGSLTAGDGTYILDRNLNSNGLFSIKACATSWCLQTRADDGTGLGGVTATAPIVADAPTLIEADRSGTTDSLSVDGGTPATATLNGTITQSPVSVGRYFFSGSPQDLDVAEVILINQTLTPAQDAAVDNYLSEKWGVPLSAP